MPSDSLSFDVTTLIFECSQNRGGGFSQKKKGRFPRRESVLPKQDFRRLLERENDRSSTGTSTKIRKSCDEKWTKDWPTACIIWNSWTHSDRRLSQVRERGGRGLLKDECWSFPPASEREARMDDPTPRSKKGRETECVLGGSCSQARAPIFFIFCRGPRFALTTHGKVTTSNHPLKPGSSKLEKSR